MTGALGAISALVGAATEVEDRITRIVVQEAVIEEAQEAGDGAQAEWSTRRVDQHREHLVGELGRLADTIAAWQTVRLP